MLFSNCQTHVINVIVVVVDTANAGIRLPHLLVPTSVRFLRRQHDGANVFAPLHPHIHGVSPARERRLRQRPQMFDADEEAAVV